MICKKCGSPIEDGDMFCPNCGTKVEEETSVVEETSVAEETPIAEENSTVEENTVEELAAEESATDMSSVQPVPNDYGNKGSFVDRFKQMPKTKLVPIGILAAVVVVIAILLANAATISNLAAKTFSSPEKYLASVEKKSAKSTIADSVEVYDNFLQAIQYDGKKYSASMKVKLGDKAKDYIEDFTDVDMKWFDNATVKSETGFQKNMLKENISVLLGKDSLLSAEMIFDIANGKFYAAVPELSSKYVEIDLEEVTGMDFEDYLENTEVLDKVIDVLPTTKELEKLSNKYYNIIMSSMKNAKKKEVTVKADGISQKVTAIEIELDEDCVENIAVNFFTELKKDADVKKIIMRIAKTLEENDLSDYDADEVYSEFVEGIEDMLDEMDFDDFDVDAEYTVYVDGKGKIVGRKLEVEDSEMGYITTQSGSKCGLEIFFDADDTTFAIEGNGKKSGNKLTGEYTVTYGDYWTDKMDICKVKVTNMNLDKMWKGYIEGKFQVSLTSSFCKEVDLPNLVSKYSLVVDADMSKNKSKATVSVLYKDEESFGTAELEYVLGKADKVSLPASKNTVEVEDDDDLMDWVDTIDFNAYLKKLKKTKLPEELLDIIEDVIDEID